MDVSLILGKISQTLSIHEGFVTYFNQQKIWGGSQMVGNNNQTTAERGPMLPSRGTLIDHFGRVLMEFTISRANFYTRVSCEIVFPMGLSKNPTKNQRYQIPPWR